MESKSDFPFTDKFVKQYGEIKFAEIENSWSQDFYKSFVEYFYGPSELAKYYGEIQFAEIENQWTDDFEESYNKFFK